MCIAYNSRKPFLTEEHWNAVLDDVGEDFEGRYVTRPTNEAPAVWNDKGKRKISTFEFGLMPFWGKPDQKQSLQYRFFNARDDKLLESKLWKPLITKKRCIIPANGFFEPHKYSEMVSVAGGNKPTDSIPFYFSLKSRPVFGFAGIWDEWTDKETGEVIKSFSIITTGPNELIRKIHNKKPRTPLILHPEDYDFWLGDVDKPEDLYDAGLFQPWPDEEMEAWQVSKQLDYGGNDERMIEPVEEPLPLNGGQQGLFSEQ